MFNRETKLVPGSHLISGLALVLGEKSVTGILIENNDDAVRLIASFLERRLGTPIGEIVPSRFTENTDLPIEEYIEKHYGAVDMSNVVGTLHSYEIFDLAEGVLGVDIAIDPSEKFRDLIKEGRRFMFTTRTVLYREGDKTQLSSMHGFDAVINDQPAPEIPFTKEQTANYQKFIQGK